MSDPSHGLVDSATAATYTLSSVASSKLRRMTKAAGLPSENILSRLAIMESVFVGASPELPPSKHAGKEIKGMTLLGKPQNGGALVVLLVARQEAGPMDPERLKKCIAAHWERGMGILDQRSKRDDVLADVTATLGGMRPELVTATALDRRPGGLGRGTRERVAAVVGRRYGRWPLEVRRLVAMAGRLDEDKALSFAAGLDDFATNHAHSAGVSEGLALEFMKSRALNRLGLNSEDQRLLRDVSDAGGMVPTDGLRERDRMAVGFLVEVGLIEIRDDFVQMSALAQRLGEEVWA